MNGIAGTSDACYVPGYVTVGICNLCGGAVKIPEMWAGTSSPLPTCEQCHATEKPRQPRLPILFMEPHYLC